MERIPPPNGAKIYLPRPSPRLMTRTMRITCRFRLLAPLPRVSLEPEPQSEIGQMTMIAKC